MPFNQALRVVDKGVVISLWVVPGAKKTALEGYDDWRKSLKFKTKEPPYEGMANRSIEGFFSSLLGKESVLLTGAKSKQKEVLVLGATLKEVQTRLRCD
jgi:uncharacterized protein (TIGR00251 family)